jgi:IS1 family transposase/transposase-like protein
MVSHLFFYQLMLIALVWLCVMLHWAWPSAPVAAGPPPLEPPPPRPKRHREPTPFTGLTTKPHCDACASSSAPHPQTPSAPPPRIVPTRGRRRQVDTAHHFCPNPDCAYRGWVGRGNLRANGHPNGGRWRQLLCIVCRGSFLETLGTLFHGKRAAVDLIVRVIACLAEGLGIRGTARGFEVDANTVLQWLVEAAEQLRAFSQHFLHDVRVRQVQLDELFALLSAVKAGEVSEAEAIERLERTPQWVWVAMDPESKLVLAIDVGERTLALAQRVVHHVAQVLAPDCAPLFLTDGFREYLTALLTHYGQWVQPPRRQTTGPHPKPRWMPLPQLLYAQVVKTVRRRRLVRVRHRVVFGTLETVNAVLAPLGCQINTAFIERLNLTIRQRVAAVGRRVTTLCKGEDGVRQQLVLFHAYHNFCLPHASLRGPLAAPIPTNGTGSARQWQPRTPAMAAGLTDHVWTLREVLLFRVPPWPQPAGV